MDLAPKPLLLAGTRLTGDKPHIGTYYGWINPIIRASEEMNVCVMIADYQSLDIYHEIKYSKVGQNLKRTLRKLLPSSVPIILESEILSILNLGLIISRLFTKSYLNRIAPFRKLRNEGNSISLNTLMYPSLMIADILAIGATHILSKPEGKFQHLDVINDVLKKGHSYYCWPNVKLKAYKKKKINIPSLDGSGPMKRDRESSGLIEIIDTSQEDIERRLLQAKIPALVEYPHLRRAQCNVIAQIRSSIDREQSPAVCGQLPYPCNWCVSNLAKEIYSDIKCRHRYDIVNSEKDIIELAEIRARQFIDLALQNRDDL